MVQWFNDTFLLFRVKVPGASELDHPDSLIIERQLHPQPTFQLRSLCLALEVGGHSNEEWLASFPASLELSSAGKIVQHHAESLFIMSLWTIMGCSIPFCESSAVVRLGELLRKNALVHGHPWPSMAHPSPKLLIALSCWMGSMPAHDGAARRRGSGNLQILQILKPQEVVQG